MDEFDVSAYGPVLERWLRNRPAMPLDNGGDGDHAIRAAISQWSDGSDVLRAGLLLAYNDLDGSHTVSQSIASPTGSYWHGIMHRREGDYSNAKYWFRRVGEHPIFGKLCGDAKRLAQDAADHPAMRFLVDQPEWEPFAFIDFVEQCIRGRCPCTDLAMAVQQREWDLLFDFCYRSTNP